MRIAIIYNKDLKNVINNFGMQNKEVYDISTVKRVADSLEKGGHNVEIIDGNMNVIDNLRNFLPKVKQGEKFGLVFNMAYGIQGESRYTHIPAMLEMLGIPYVGSSPSGHALALDKIITKIILQKNNIPTPDFWVFSNKSEDMSIVKFPVIVKPKMESVSFGLRVVYNHNDLKDAVDYIIKEFNQQALVEKFISGREFAVGLIGNEPLEVFPVLEIDLNGNPDAIQTVNDKTEKPKTKICPANISKEKTKEIQEISKKVFKSIGLRDFSRVDIRMDKDGNIYVLEVNSMASLGITGSYVNAANVYGLDFTKLVNKILDVAAIRYFTKEINQYVPNLDLTETKLSVKIRSFLRSHRENTEKFLEILTNINTNVRNIEGVNQIGNILKKKLTTLGFNTEIFPQSEVGNILLFTNNDKGEYDYLIIGKLDNNIKLSQQKYFSRNEQKYFGSGIWEHKSGLVSMMLALQSLKYLRLLRKIKIGILLTSDNTIKDTFSRNIIESKSRLAKYIFGLHGGLLDGGIVTSRAGSAVYNFVMTLKEPKSNIDVPTTIKIFSKLVYDWTNLSNKNQGVIVSPMDLEIKSNITEPFVHAEAVIGVRFKDIEGYKSINSKIKKIIPNSKYKNLIDYHIEGGVRRTSLVENEKSIKLFNKIKKIADNLDITLKKEHRWSSANISICDNSKCIIDGFGASGYKEHNGIEYIIKHTMVEKSLLLTLLLCELNNSIEV